MLSILPLNYLIYCLYSSIKCINFSLKCERGNMHNSHEHPIYPTILYPTVLALGMKLSSGIVTTPCVADCEIKVKSLKMTSIATYRRRLFINPIYTNTFQLSYTLLVILKMSPTHLTILRVSPTTTSKPLL